MKFIVVREATDGTYRSGSAPRMYDTLRSASAEAERLAGLYPGTTYVTMMSGTSHCVKKEQERVTVFD